jgi:peroxiredoxin
MSTSAFAIMSTALLARGASAFAPGFRLATSRSFSSKSHAVAQASEVAGAVKAGDAVPDVVFKTRTRIDSADDNPFDWKDVTTDDLFKDKRVALFSLPGAFTPTCSSTHLPGYESAYEEMGKLGIDEIYCLSVNDAFVMRKWGLDQGLEEDKTVGGLGFKKVKLIPDGACAFTRGMGMSCTHLENRAFGERSWRYSCVINNGWVEKVFAEGGKVPISTDQDPYEVSDPKTMLAYLTGAATPPPPPAA